MLNHIASQLLHQILEFCKQIANYGENKHFREITTGKSEIYMYFNVEVLPRYLCEFFGIVLISKSLLKRCGKCACKKNKYKHLYEVQ